MSPFDENQDWLFLCKDHYELCLVLWLTWIIHIPFFRSWTRDFDCEKKIGQKYLDGPVFTEVFLRVKYTDAAWFKILFWTPDISFNIYLSLVAPWTKVFNNSVENQYSSLNWLNQYHSAHPGPIFRKSQMKFGGCYQKSHLNTL